MRLNKGFTLIEHLIIIAVIVILAFAFWGTVGSRKAGAQTFNSNSAMVLFLAKQKIPFLWTDRLGHLTLFVRPTIKRWSSAVDACTELKAMEPHLHSVTLSTGSETELYWSAEGGTTNIASRDEAICQ
jgi:type II secretory pathway pseudopilin PulG